MLLPLYILFVKLREESPPNKKGLRTNLQQQIQILSLIVALLQELPPSERWICEDEKRIMNENDAISSLLLLQARCVLIESDLDLETPEEIIQALIEAKSYWLALQVANQIQFPRSQIASIFVSKLDTADSDLMNACNELLRGDPTGSSLCGFIQALLDKDEEISLPACVNESFRTLLEEKRSVTTPVVTLLLKYGRVEDSSQFVEVNGLNER